LKPALRKALRRATIRPRKHERWKARNRKRKKLFIAISIKYALFSCLLSPALSQTLRFSKGAQSKGAFVIAFSFSQLLRRRSPRTTKTVNYFSSRKIHLQSEPSLAEPAGEPDPVTDFGSRFTRRLCGGLARRYSGGPFSVASGTIQTGCALR
jgi:hypothetical protein